MIFYDFLLLLSGMFYLVLQYSFAYSADLFLSIQVHKLVLIHHS